MAQTTYNSALVNIAWAGVVFEGLAPDSFIVAKKNTDVTDEESGADSNVCISFLPDNTGMVEVSLQQGSNTDRILSGIVLAQQESGQIVRSDMIINDPSGSVLARMVSAHIKGTPEIDLGSSATGKTRKYTFFVEKYSAVSQGAGVTDGNDAGVVAAIATAVSFLA